MKFSKEFYDKFYRLDAKASKDAINMACELFIGKQCLLISKANGGNIYLSQCTVTEICGTDRSLFGNIGDIQHICCGLFCGDNEIYILAIDKPFTCKFLNNLKNLAK